MGATNDGAAKESGGIHEGSRDEVTILYTLYSTLCTLDDTLYYSKCASIGYKRRTTSSHRPNTYISLYIGHC